MQICTPQACQFHVGPGNIQKASYLLLDELDGPDKHRQAFRYHNTFCQASGKKQFNCILQ